MPSQPLPTGARRLKLSEAVALLAARFGYKPAEAAERIEQAVLKREISDIRTVYPDGSEIKTDVAAWGVIDWESGIVTVEASFGGSPPLWLPAYPLLGEDAFLALFRVEPDRAADPVPRTGRPPRHDWDRFWIEVTRLVHEDGFPETRQALTEHMLDWFIAEGDEAIDARTVEKKISLLYRETGRE